jgi:hypothetical protein
MGHCHHIKYQKRGLSYSHLLLFLHEDNHFLGLVTIDNIVCAKFPSDEADPELLSIITADMVDGHVVLRTKAICACHAEQGRRLNAINISLRLFTMKPSCKNGFQLYQRREGVGDGPTIRFPSNCNIEATLNNNCMVPHNPYLSKI